MKKLTLLAVLTAFILTSCTSIKEIGRLNVISTRNVELGNQKYAKIATYAGETKKELKKAKCTSLDEAVNAIVRKYPGGEFLTNAKVWMIIKGNKTYFSASGDIWGVVNEDGNITRERHGFAVGDEVTWSPVAGQFEKGTVDSFVDNETCIIKKENGNLVKVKITKLNK